MPSFSARSCWAAMTWSRIEPEPTRRTVGTALPFEPFRPAN
jgi:hypothetical protein